MESVMDMSSPQAVHAFTEALVIQVLDFKEPKLACKTGSRASSAHTGESSDVS